MTAADTCYLSTVMVLVGFQQWEWRAERWPQKDPALLTLNRQPSTEEWRPHGDYSSHP